MFNHETQSNVLDFHLKTLSGKKNTNTDSDSDSDSDDEEFSNESAWPTTRQGDQNEEDIRLLKQQVLKLEETNNYLIRVIKEQIGINF
jgi:DNA-directed RNA polymerase specialized sigma subunit